MIIKKHIVVIYNCSYGSSRLGSFAKIPVPPKIMPMQSMLNLLREGMRAAITCQILEGDLPVTFRWERDGGVKELGVGASTRRLDEYSSSLVIERVTAKHTGNYTCIASNVAGTERFTVPITVNGKTTIPYIV